MSDRRIIIREIDAECWLALAVDGELVDQDAWVGFGTGEDPIAAFTQLALRVDWVGTPA